MIAHSYLQEAQKAMFILSFVLPAFAADPVISTPATADEHVVEVLPFHGNPETSVLAIIVSCWPSDSAPSLKYVESVQGFGADIQGLKGALELRDDIALVTMINPTPAEFTGTLDTIKSDLGDGAFGKTLFVFEGLATGGDMNDERLLCPGSGIAFSDVTKRLAPLGTASIGILDASRDVSKSTNDLGPTFGPTANDWRDAGMPDGFAISASPEGKYATAGVIPAFAKTIAASNGGTMTMGDIVLGLRQHAPLLELALSTGVDPKDEWTNNLGRQVFPGGGLTAPIASLPTKPISSAKKKVPTGCYMAGAGILTGIASGVFAVNASTTYDTLVGYNAVGAESQADLDAATIGYHTEVGVAIGLGILGSAAIIGGTTWTILDRGKAKVEFAGPTVSGTF